jgi:hypothetical protein
MKFKITNNHSKEAHKATKKFFILWGQIIVPCFLFFYKECTNIETMFPLKSGTQLRNKSASKTQECNPDIALHIPYTNGNC